MGIIIREKTRVVYAHSLQTACRILKRNKQTYRIITAWHRRSLWYMLHHESQSKLMINRKSKVYFVSIILLFIIKLRYSTWQIIDEVGLRTFYWEIWIKNNQNNSRRKDEGGTFKSEIWILKNHRNNSHRKDEGGLWALIADCIQNSKNRSTNQKYELKKTIGITATEKTRVLPSLGRENERDYLFASISWWWKTKTGKLASSWHPSLGAAGTSGVKSSLYLMSNLLD